MSDDLMDKRFQRYAEVLDTEEGGEQFLKACEMYHIDPTNGVKRMFAFAMAIGSVDGTAMQLGTTAVDVLKVDTFTQEPASNNATQLEHS